MHASREFFLIIYLPLSREPISDFPADLLVFHIVVPVTVTWAKPKRLFRKLFENWWKITSRALRLTSFMFGGRHHNEEGTDGGLVRAPSYDGITVVPGRRMLIPVNEDGTLKNPGEVPVGQDDQLNYTVVYIPPNFKARVIIFLFLMWFCGSLFCCSITVLPRKYIYFFVKFVMNTFKLTNLLKFLKS